jgi:hypothetical protein
MVVFLNRKGPVPSLPDVAAGVIMLMITADVRGHQPHHVGAQVAIAPRPERQVEMGGHQTISEEADIDAFARLAGQLTKGREVAILAKDGATTIAAIEDMVTVAAQSVACTAWHGGIMAVAGVSVKIKVPCPLVCSFPVVLPYWWQCREESCMSPEALTS